jgi:hypothetical protein
MLDKVPSSNPFDLPMPAEGAYVWHLKIIVVVVGIDSVSREYESNIVADFASDKKKKVTSYSERAPLRGYIYNPYSHCSHSSYLIQLCITCLIWILIYCPFYIGYFRK